MPRMEGFVVFDYATRYGEGLREMAGWLAERQTQIARRRGQGPRDVSRKPCSNFTPARILASSFCKLPMSNVRTPE